MAVRQTVTDPETDWVELDVTLFVLVTVAVPDEEELIEADRLVVSDVEPLRDALDVRVTLPVEQLVGVIVEVKHSVVVWEELEETLLVRVTVSVAEGEGLIVDVRQREGL